MTVLTKRGKRVVSVASFIFWTTLIALILGYAGGVEAGTIPFLGEGHSNVQSTP